MLKVTILGDPTITEVGPIMYVIPSALHFKIYNIKQPDELKVIVPITRENLYAVLHEQGHIQDPDIVNYLDNVLQHEVTAWKYVFQCVKPEYYMEVTRFALKCLRTYTDPCDHSDNDLLKMLQD